MFGRKKRIEVLETKVRFLEERLEFQKKINKENIDRLNKIEALLSANNNASGKN